MLFGTNAREYVSGPLAGFLLADNDETQGVSDMNKAVLASCWSFRLLFGAGVAWALTSFGAEQQAERTAPRKPVEVEFFSAMEAGQIHVRVVPNSYSSLMMGVGNVTGNPLRVRLPAHFAAVPVARVQAWQAMQMRGVAASLSDNFGQYGNTQGLGGSFAGPWWGNSLAENGDSYLALAPGQVTQARVPCFCLEYGRPDPNRRTPYVICPLAELNGQPALAELLRQFAKQGINQSAVQLAVWNIATGVPWPELSRVRFPRTETSRGHRVTPVEVAAGQQLAAAARYASLSTQR